MKNILILICILCFGGTLAHAQDSTRTKPKFYATIGTGGQWIEVSDFNKKLTDAGFNTLNTRVFCGQTTLGIAGEHHNVSMVLGFAIPQRNSNEDNSKITSFAQFRVDVLYGYAFKVVQDFIIMPVAGINTQSNTISLQKSTNAVTLNNALSNPISTGTTITNESFGLNIGARFIWKAGKKLTITPNVMYAFPISNYNWKSNAQDLQDVPRVNLGGFFAGVALGFN